MDFIFKLVGIFSCVTFMSGENFNVTSDEELTRVWNGTEKFNETENEKLVENESNSAMKSNFTLNIELNSTREIDKMTVESLEKNVSCFCHGDGKKTTDNEKFRCPCIENGSQFNITCKSMKNNVTSSGGITCDVNYDGDILKSVLPFICDCSLNSSRPLTGQNLKKIECDCVDIPDPVCNCSLDPSPSWCNCPCVCREVEIYPGVTLRHKCTCNSTSSENVTIIKEPSLTNSSCRHYVYANGNVVIWINCKEDVTWTTSTESSVDLNVSTNCPCEQVRLPNSKIVILYNCKCSSSRIRQSPTLMTSLSSECRCDEIDLGGEVKVKYNCNCPFDKCRCEEARGILVCVDCQLESKSTKKLTMYDYQPKCECEEEKLFGGQVLVQFNCSCSKSTKVLQVRRSRQSSDEDLYIPCPCRNNAEVSRLVKRNLMVAEPHLVCSCNPIENTINNKSESKSSTQVSSTSTTPSSTSSEKITTTMSLSSELPIKDPPREFWVRTVIEKDLNSTLNTTKKELESRLASAYVLAFYRRHKSHLGLSYRRKRQLSQNITVQIVKIDKYLQDLSQTEVIYVVRSDGELVNPKIVVEDAQLLVSDKKMDEYLKLPVSLVSEVYEEALVTPESSHGSESSGSSTTGIVVGLTLSLLFIVLICAAYCYWNKKRKRENEQNLSPEPSNRARIFEEFIHSPASQENKMADPLLSFSGPPPPVPKPRIKNKNNLQSHNERNNDTSEEQISRSKHKKKKHRTGRPLPLDIHRENEGSPIKHGVFDHVPDSPLIRQKTLTPKSKHDPAFLSPSYLENPVPSSSGISSDIVTISGSLEPIPTYHRVKKRNKPKSRSNLEEVDAMLDKRASRVCSSERLIEDIREELKKFHRSIDKE